jgi:hypothetical protein
MKEMGIPALFLAAILAGGSATAEPPVAPAVMPVQAELLADLQARQLKVGELVYAKVFSNWEGPGCSLEKGAILEAKVVAVVPHSKTSRASQVALSFDGAQCAHAQMGPFSLILAAIAVPEEDNSSRTLDMPRAFGSATSSGAPNGMRSMTSYNSDVWWIMQNGFARFPNVHAGGVYGIRGLALSVATGPEKSSVLTSSDRDVAVFKHTELLLIPGALVAVNGAGTGAASESAAAPGSGATESAPGSTSGNSTTAPSAAAPVEEALLEDETCAPPDCSVALPDGVAADGHADGHIAASISLGSLGYAQRTGVEMDTLGQDETLSYLSPKELLVTFNPHGLVPRLGDMDGGGTVRIIRAALVDTDTHKVKRIVDWHLPDDKQYLWPLADHRVLVHVGNELRVYGAGLVVEESMVLDGPLWFLRTDPAGETIVAGIVQERHSPELHAKLRENLEKEPDENVRVLVLNRRFETTATATSTTEFLPPVLLDEGEVKLYRQSEKRFHLVMQTWDSERRSLARFSSSCTPEMSTSSPDLLFLVSCNALTKAREYRVLRADGKVILQGEIPVQEMGYAALGNEQVKEVVLKTVETEEPVDPGEVFHPSDLKSERLRVYSAVNGKRVFSVQVNEPVASVGGYAMAPDGRELAVLTRDEIAIYTMPQN